jgi:hypothetical protein
MATIAAPEAPVASAVQKERAFFFYMALAMFAATVAGFVRFQVLGLSNFGEPWFVHVHGISMMGWLVLFIAQNGLVARGNLAIHRKLGILTALYSIWVPIVSAMILYFNVMTLRTPPFFSAEFLIAMDGLTVAAFAALTWAALALRKRSDWHKRLMLGGTILLIQPGLGRLIPLSMLGTGVPYLVFPGHLLLFAVAIGYDWRTRGRIHPAYYWGLGALVIVTLLPIYVASSAPLAALVAALKG